VKAGATSGNKKEPMRTTRLYSNNTTTMTIWKDISLSPGWYTFNKVSCKETFSSDDKKWYIGLNADSCEPWKEAPTDAQLHDIIKRYYSGESFPIHPFPLELLPSQTDVMQRMTNDGVYTEGDQVNFDKRKETCYNMIAEIIDAHRRFHPSQDLDYLDIYKNRGHQLPFFAITSKEEDFVEFLPGVKKFVQCTDIKWNPVMSKTITQETTPTSSVDLDAASASSSVQVPQPQAEQAKPKKDYPYAVKLTLAGQFDIRSLINGNVSIATVDVSFPSTGFCQAFGLCNPLYAVEILPHVIKHAEISFIGTLDIHEMIFNVENSKAIINPDTASEVIIIKSLGKVWTQLPRFLRKAGIEVNWEFAAESANRLLRTHCVQDSNKPILEDRIELARLADAVQPLQKRIYAHFTSENQLHILSRGKVYNLLENPSPITVETADNYRFYSLSNVRFIEDNLVEYRERSQRYFETGNSEDKAYLDEIKNVFGAEFMNIIAFAKGGKHIAINGGFCGVVYAVHKSLDTDYNYDRYISNPYYAPGAKATIVGEAVSSSSSASSSVPEETEEEKPELEDDLLPPPKVSKTQALQGHFPLTSLPKVVPTPVEDELESDPGSDVPSEEEEHVPIVKKSSKLIPPQIISSKRIAPPSPKKPTAQKKRRQ
jgi:hypothetical protein